MKFNFRVAICTALLFVSTYAVADVVTANLLFRDPYWFGWSKAIFQKDGNDIVISFDGTKRVRFASTGTISVNGTPIGGGSTPPTGTGFYHVTSGAMDAAAVTETGTGSVVRATGSISGNAATVSASDAGGDTTTWPCIATSQTGSVPCSTDGSLTYNATTHALSATTFAGTGTNLTGIPEGGLSTTDITTNNATTSKHGFLLKLNNTATTYMDGTGAWSTPAGSVTTGANTWTGAQNIAVSSATAVTVGPNGTTNPVVTVKTNTASQADGVLIDGLASGSGVQFTATGSGSTVPITLTPKGQASVLVANNNTNLPGYGFVAEPTTGIGRDGSLGGLDLYVSATREMRLQTNGIIIPSGSGYGLGSSTAGSSADINFARDAPGIAQINGGTSTTKGALKLIADAAGGYAVQGSNTEQLTLSLIGTGTATASNLAPANSRIKAIITRVTTSFGTTVSYTVKITGGNVWKDYTGGSTTLSNVTSGSTYVLLPNAFADDFNAEAATITVTGNAIAIAGVIRITVIYEQYSAPTS